MPKINILMCTFNGAPFLAPQLQSILDQDHTDWRLWLSDDHSNDETFGQLENFCTSNSDRTMTPVKGPKRGAAANFLSLLANPELAGQWVAFSDQDDIWLPQKLSRAVAHLKDVRCGVYASRSIHINAAGKELGPSPLINRPLGFGNALVQNVLAGNTLVLTPGATDLIRDLSTEAQNVPFHDWWIYLLASGAGLHIFNDPEPSILYRQHRRNLLGAGDRQMFKRAEMLKNGTYALWMDANLTALEASKEHLTSEARAQLNATISWRKALGRRPTPLDIGLYRQTWKGDRVLQILAATRRI